MQKARNNPGLEWNWLWGGDSLAGPDAKGKRPEPPGASSVTGWGGWQATVRRADCPPDSGAGFQLEGQVVDQPGAADKGRDQNHQLAILGAGRAQAVRLADFQVVGAEAGRALQLLGLGDQYGVVALASLDGAGDLFQAAI